MYHFINFLFVLYIMGKRTRRTNQKSRRKTYRNKSRRKTYRNKSRRRRKSLKIRNRVKRRSSIKKNGGRFLGKQAAAVSQMKNKLGTKYVVPSHEVAKSGDNHEDIDSYLPIGNVRYFSKGDVVGEAPTFEPSIYGTYMGPGYYSREGIEDPHPDADMSVSYFQAHDPGAYDVSITYDKKGTVGIKFMEVTDLEGEVLTDPEGKQYYDGKIKSINMKKAERSLAEKDVEALEKLSKLDLEHNEILLTEINGEPCETKVTGDYYASSFKYRPVTLTLRVYRRINRARIPTFYNQIGPGINVKKMSDEALKVIEGRAGKRVSAAVLLMNKNRVRKQKKPVSTGFKVGSTDKDVVISEDEPSITLRYEDERED